jgi:hypothetical protein
MRRRRGGEQILEAVVTDLVEGNNCAHGMYVLDDILKTHTGSFGPGSFVWFLEGMEIEHGATRDNDVTFLFVANGRAGRAGP